MQIKILKEFVPLGLSSRVMIILLNFQSITEYCEKNRNKKLPPEDFPNNKFHRLYYILKISAQTDEICGIARGKTLGRFLDLVVSGSP